MILCDREIEALVESGTIVITDVPPKELWTSTAIDLTLHGVLVEWTPKPHPSGTLIHPRPKSQDFNVQKLMDDKDCARKVTIDKQNGYHLRPRAFVLGYTQQKVRFPNRARIAARVEGKSSLARLGVGIHVTAPTIHAGFGEKEASSAPLPIQLEIFNLGEWTVVLDEGMPICQLIFEEVREVPTAG